MFIQLSKNKIKKAFTMGEILIVMVVLGVVMSILVRTIVRVDPDKDKVLFVKSYNAVEQIISNSVNDSSKYDQNIYTDADLENWEGAAHFNLSFPPLDDVYISYVSGGERKSACKSGCNSSLTQKNAPCYYLVEYMNTIGKVSCSPSTTTTMNFKNSVGVCFWNWDASNIASSDVNAHRNAAKAKRYFDAVIDPSCTRTSISDTKHGYAVRIYRNGTMSIPENSSLVDSANQDKAIKWIKNPTTYKD